MVYQTNTYLNNYMYDNRVNNEMLNSFGQVSLIYDNTDTGQPSNNHSSLRLVENFSPYSYNYSSNFNNVSRNPTNSFYEWNSSNSNFRNSDHLNERNIPNQINFVNQTYGLENNYSNRLNSAINSLDNSQIINSNFRDLRTNQLTRRNSLNNSVNNISSNYNSHINNNSNHYQQDQFMDSTDSEQYLINSYYQLSNQSNSQTEPDENIDLQNHQQQQHLIENYHHLNHSSNNNQITNNHNYIYDYYTEYMNERNRDSLTFNSMIFNPSFIKRAKKRAKQLCSKNFPCMLLVLIPVCIATVLILVFMLQDKTDKDDLHQYAIYAFVIFSVAFIFPFALFFFIVVVNKIIKKYNKCFNPNFINNEFDDFSNSASNDYNLNITANLANTNHVNNLIDGLPNDDQHGLNIRPNNICNPLSLIQASVNLELINSQNTNQQISTLNVDQLQYNNDQFINNNLNRNMVDSNNFNRINYDELEQNQNLSRMNSIQRRRLIRQNAFECPPEQLSDSANLNEDKPPCYELALLCPKKDGQKISLKNDSFKIIKINDSNLICDLNNNLSNNHLTEQVKNTNNLNVRTTKSKNNQDRRSSNTSNNSCLSNKSTNNEENSPPPPYDEKTMKFK